MSHAQSRSINGACVLIRCVVLETNAQTRAGSLAPFFPLQICSGDNLDRELLAVGLSNGTIMYVYISVRCRVAALCVEGLPFAAGLDSRCFVCATFLGRYAYLCDAVFLRFVWIEFRFAASLCSSSLRRNAYEAAVSLEFCTHAKRHLPPCIHNTSLSLRLVCNNPHIVCKRIALRGERVHGDDLCDLLKTKHPSLSLCFQRVRLRRFGAHRLARGRAHVPRRMREFRERVAALQRCAEWEW